MFFLKVFQLPLTETQLKKRVRFPLKGKMSSHWVETRRPASEAWLSRRTVSSGFCLPGRGSPVLCQPRSLQALSTWGYRWSPGASPRLARLASPLERALSHRSALSPSLLLPAGGAGAPRPPLEQHSHWRVVLGWRLRPHTLTGRETPGRHKPHHTATTELQIILDKIAAGCGPAWSSPG